jgi:hypothetical protein
MRRIGKAFAALLLLAASACDAAAETNIQVGPSSPGGPPVAVGPGWKYELRGADVHMFICQQESCNRTSRVSYRLYTRNDTMTLEGFRREQETVVKMLEQRAPPGTQIAILSIEGDEGTGLPRVYKSKRLMTAADGRKEYVISSVLFGQGSSASLISSSLDEKATDANHAVFALAVMLLVNQPKP